MKKTNIITLSVLVPLVIVGLILYFQGRNIHSASFDNTVKKAVKPQQTNAQLDHGTWYKRGFQDAKENLKEKLEETSLIIEAEASKEKDYQEIYKLAYEQRNLLIAGMASKKSAELTDSDTLYIRAANIFIENSLMPNTDDEQRVYSLSSAKNLFQKSLDINPKSIDANNGMALAVIQLGQDPPMVGIGYLKKSLEIDSNNFSTNYLYGQMLVMSTQYEKAVKVYNKLLNLQPSNAGLYFTISDIYGKMGNTEKAKEFLNKAKSLNK